MSWLNIFRHLLPRAAVWWITLEKLLRNFFEGLTVLPAAVKQFLDLVFFDAFPAVTRELFAMEQQWGQPETGLSEPDRRARLAAAIAEQGGQSPRYIQDRLHSAGFTDVYIHEWWVPGSDPVLARDPFDYVSPAVGGELLVNKITNVRRDWKPLCGEALAQCGESIDQCGNYDGLLFTRKEYEMPVDGGTPVTYSKYVYFAGETFPDAGSAPLARKDELEDLVLQLCPGHLWIMMIINYT